MRLVETSVKRPVGVIIIVLAIIALGVVSARNLVIDLFPKIDLPVAVVATNYEDAAPEDIENVISQPIEAAISSVEGIDTIQSQSQAGSSLVLMMFKNGVDLDQALLDVRENVDQVAPMLPDEAGDPSIIRFSPDQLPVIWVGLTGKDAASLTKVAEDEVVPYFERLNGVASVTIEGEKQREIQVILDRSKMNTYGITTETIIQSLNSANESSSVGTVDKGSKDLQLRVVGEYESVSDIEETIMQTEDDSVIRLTDIATVEDTFKKEDGITLVNGSPSLVLSVMKKTDGNTVDVAEDVLASMKELNKDLPDGVELETIIDTSEFITMSIDSVIQNILLGGFISVFILLLFLKSIRATIVIGLSIPIAIISTFTLMYFTGETLNILTLGGLALGIGMMVDSSIVILENIYSYHQRGYSLYESATKGASELTPAIIASTTTTLVVFLPIVYVDGIASDLFTPLALTVSFSLIASLVVAITLVPMLSSKLLSSVMDKQGKRYWFNTLLERVADFYQSVLEKILKFRKTTFIAVGIAIVASLALTPFIGAEFIPSSDQGQIQVDVETAPGSTLDHTEVIIDRVSEKIEPFEKYIEMNFVSAGGGGFDGMSAGGSEASFTMQLLPASERDKSTAEIVEEMDESFQEIPSATIKVSEMEEGMGMGEPIQVQLSGPEHEVLRDLSETVVEEMSSVDGVFNPESGASEGVPQMAVHIDAAKAKMYGLTEEQVTGQIQLQFTGQMATRYREQGEELDVYLYYPEDERSTINDLQNMPIQSPTGASISLEDVATFEEEQGPVTLLRQNQQPQMNVSSEIMNRDLGGVLKDVEAKLDAMSFPEGYSYSIGGEAEDMVKSFSDLALALVFSIFLVYAVMAVQFENFLFPFIIMFAMPATIIGVIGGLYISGIAFSIPAFIGIIMLAGIVVNNSIVLVDYINILRRRGMERYDAIIEAGRSRLRPILMTTLTTVLGMVPLGLALGEGAEMQQPLAITIIFGLTVSSIFTLILIPVVYTMFDDITKKFTRRKKRA
ncbi:MAG TPA: efflux RND transporter permease subunit [Bacillota bacterium]|nr:efflux RND transporter permease subunit [Bacillota bacterium]